MFKKPAGIKCSFKLGQPSFKEFLELHRQLIGEREKTQTEWKINRLKLKQEQEKLQN